VIVTAALAWWDEPPETLDACIRSVAAVADRVVAIDGAYSRYPDATVTSPAGQAEAIRAAAEAAGMECLVLQPDRLWRGQVEKRTALLSLAAAGSDWIAVVDADHLVHCDPGMTRLSLQQADPGVDAFYVPLTTPVPQGVDIDRASATAWHKLVAGTRVDFMHLYRAHPGFRVERFHWWYSAVSRGERVWMWGGDGSYPPAHTGAFPDPLYRVEHASYSRDEVRILRGRAFVNDRDRVIAATGQEDDQPGLFRPEYDYATLGADW
jgi:hypothetical protein